MSPSCRSFRAILSLSLRPRDRHSFFHSFSQFRHIRFSMHNRTLNDTNDATLHSRYILADILFNIFARHILALFSWHNKLHLFRLSHTHTHARARIFHSFFPTMLQHILLSPSYFLLHISSRSSAFPHNFLPYHKCEIERGRESVY